MSKYVADVISRIRRHTDNTGNTAASGIPDSHFLDYINDGQDRLQSLIIQAHNNVFEAQAAISIVAGTRSYALPADAFLKNKVSLVEFSETTDNEDYRPLKKIHFRELRTTEVNFPSEYAVLNGYLFISPVPNTSTGRLRVTYSRRLNDLDIRRGTISVRTLTPTQLTALTLSTTGDDPTALSANTYLSVNDRDGNVTMANIRYDSYDSGTGVVTLTGGAFTFAAGETAAVGSYVTVGPYTTTHTDLEDAAERYLALYCQTQILMFEESSTDYVQAQQMLAAMEQEIVDLYTPDGTDINTPLILSNYYR